MCPCLCLAISVYVCLRLRLYAYVYLRLCRCLCLCLSMHVHGYVYVYVGLGPSTFIVHLCPSTSTIELCNRATNWSPRSAPLISQARGGTFKRYRNPLEICVFVNMARIDATQLVATTRLWHGQMLIFLVEMLTFLISGQVVATPWVATTCAMLINTHIFNGFWHVLKLPYLTWIPRNADIAKYIMFFTILSVAFSRMGDANASQDPYGILRS